VKDDFKHLVSQQRSSELDNVLPQFTGDQSAPSCPALDNGAGFVYPCLKIAQAAESCYNSGEAE